VDTEEMAEFEERLEDLEKLLKRANSASRLDTDSAGLPTGDEPSGNALHAG
jgi:hypothetical protein